MSDERPPEHGDGPTCHCGETEGVTASWECKRHTADAYRDLLHRYMHHVLEEEGTTFADFGRGHYHLSEQQFSTEEWAELRELGSAK